MTDRASEPVVTRLLTWTPYVLLGGLLLGLVRWVSAPISNADTFFHLRYGHEFLHGWSLRHPGHVSSLGQQDWVPTQWASQMVMAVMESAFGLAGVAWLAGVVVLATTVAVFLVARQYADPLPSVVVTLLVVLATTSDLVPRPQVVSYLLILVVTHVWLRAGVDLRPRWWLVPLSWGWACVHGMWPIGALIGFVAVAGIALDHRSRLRELRPRLLRLLAIPVLSLVVAALTPVGPRLFSAVLLVGGRGEFHGEWSATNFRSYDAAVAAILVVVTLLVWLRGRDLDRPGWLQLFMLLLAAGWMAYAVRTVPVGAVMVVPLVAAALQTLVGSSRPAPGREHGLVVGIAVVAVAVLTAVVPFTADKPAAVPSWVNPALDRLPAGTTVQTTDLMGGYLMWRHPGLNPVIDGYSDAYTTRHLGEQFDQLMLRPGWDKTLRRNKVRYALLPTRSRLVYALTTFADWRVLDTSKEVVMLEAPDGWST